MTLEELTAEVARLSGELNTTNANAAKLVKEKRDALSRAETAEAAIESANSATLTDLDKALKRAEKAEKDAKAADLRATASDKNLRSFRQEAAIANILTAHKVQADDYRAVKAIFKMELDEDTDEPSIGGKSLDDYAKGFFSKEGKRYTAAADHSGGGASGSGNSQSRAFSKPPETPDELHRWMRWSAENKDEANALASEWKRGDLEA